MFFKKVVLFVMCFFLVACSTKTTTTPQQSPINIIEQNTKAISANTLNVNYSSDVENPNFSHHKWHVKNDNNINISAIEYKLEQFHLHNSSEHQLNGLFFPMEFHFVHKNNKNIAVIGLFVDIGNENAMIEKLLNNENFVLGDLLEDKHYYNYTGSLTTTPFTEQVKWYVAKEPIFVSSQQLESLKDKAEPNRKIQALFDRSVYFLENTQ